MSVHVVGVGASLADLPADDLVVVADDPWLVGGVDGVVAAFAAEALVEPAVLRSPDGRIVMGRAGDVRGEATPRVSRRLHSHRAGVTEVVVLNGGLLDVVAGVPVAVVLDASSELRAKVAAGAGGDLARLLRYDGAVDPATWYRVVADEIVEVPLWTPEFCMTVVQAAEAVGAWTPDEHDPVPGNEVSLAAISPRLFAHLEDHLATHVMPLLNEVWPIAEFAGVQDAFVIKYVPGGTDGLRLHHDVAQIERVGSTRRWLRGRRARIPSSGLRQLGRARRPPARMAVARDPPAHGRSRPRRREVRPHCVARHSWS